MGRKAQRGSAGKPSAEPPLKKPAANSQSEAASTPAAKDLAAASVPAKSARRSRPAAKKKAAKKKKPAEATPAAEKPHELGPLDAMSATDLAAAVGVNRRTVHEWYREGCPRNLMEAIGWVLKHKRGDKLGTRNAPLSGLLAGGGIDPDGEAQLSLQRQMHAEKLRGQQIDNEQSALALAEKKRDLVSRKLVKRDVATIFVRIKERLLVAPDRFEPRFPAEVRVECKQDLDDFCRKLLMELRTMPVGGEDVEELILAASDEIRAARRVAAEALLGQAQPMSGLDGDGV